MRKFRVAPKYIKASTFENGQSYPGEGYRYLTKHGIGPGTLPKDVTLLKVEDLPNWYTAIYLDRFLTKEELEYYDIYPEWIQDESDIHGSANINCTTSSDPYQRVYVVIDRDTGLPISGQGYGVDGNEYGTLQECINRLNLEVQRCHECGLTEFTDEDFQIKNFETGEIVL
jgi:hypothetical protein